MALSINLIQRLGTHAVGKRRIARRRRELVVFEKGTAHRTVLCLYASYKITETAIAELSDSTVARCGMRSKASHTRTSSSESPFPSLPTNIADGFRQSHQSMVSTADGDVPTT